MRFGATIARGILALVFLVCTAFQAHAVRSLSEDELDQTNAGGVELRIIGDETTIVEMEAPDLFVNQLFGQNEVVTRVVIEIVTKMDFTSVQINNIDQTRDGEDIAAVLDAEKNVTLILDGAQGDGAAKAVVNNVFGRNQVETSVNLTIFVPTGSNASAGNGYSNPFAGGSAGSTGAPLATPTVEAAAAPQYERPTTLSGAASLMQNLAEQNPQAAPALQTGISAVQSLRK